MANFLLRGALAGAVTLAFSVTACSEVPRELSLQLLASEQSTVDGHLVITEGEVQRFDDPLHFWLEDSALNRVALHPEDSVADYVGEYVRVTGRFSADRERGRRIDVSDIQAIDRP